MGSSLVLKLRNVVTACLSGIFDGGKFSLIIGMHDFKIGGFVQCRDETSELWTGHGTMTVLIFLDAYGNGRVVVKAGSSQAPLA